MPMMRCKYPGVHVFPDTSEMPSEFCVCEEFATCLRGFYDMFASC